MGRPSRSNTPSIKNGTGTTSGSGNDATLTDLSKLTQKPPSHLPHENDPRHTAFLTRSLSRNDVELATLEKLNASIRSIKNIIVDSFGEQALLDIALQGKVENDVASQQKLLNEKGEEYCVLQEEFLLRMKLRRKLLNRLARRILRLSHAMDGNIVGGAASSNSNNNSSSGIFPPQLPKYGIEKNFPPEVWDLTQLPKNVTEEELANAKKNVEDYVASKLNKEEKLQKITMLRNGDDVNIIEKDDTPEELEYAASTSVEQSEVERTDPTITEGLQPNQNEQPLNDSMAVLAEPYKSLNPVVSTEVSNDESLLSSSNLRKAIQAVDPLILDKEFRANVSTLIEYDEEYEKVVNLNDRTTRWALNSNDLKAVQKTESDFLEGPNQTLGIGASVRSMSARDKLTEWKRWSTELLSRIPIQPSFEDLGYDKLIFGGVEERMKKARGTVEVKEESVVNESKDIKQHHMLTRNKRKTRNSSCDDNVDNEIDTVTEPVGSQDIDGEDKQTSTMPPLKKQKWFSLQPIPSFRDQDYNCTLMIQNELITTSLQTQSRLRLEESTNQYNKAYRRSVELQNQKVNIEEALRKLSYTKNMELNKARTDQAMDLAAKKSQYLKEKELFEQNKRTKINAKLQAYGTSLDPITRKAMTMTDRDIVNRTMQSILDRVVIRAGPKELSHGTSFLSSMAMSKTPAVAAAATTLSHVVDCAIQRAESYWVPNKTLDDAQAEFSPPVFGYAQHNEDQTDSLRQRHERQESELRNQLNEVNRLLTASESERSQAWSRLVKVKGESDPPQLSRPVARGSSTVDPNKAASTVSTKVVAPVNPKPDSAATSTHLRPATASVTASAPATVSNPSLHAAVSVAIAPVSVSNTTASAPPTSLPLPTPVPPSPVIPSDSEPTATVAEPPSPSEVSAEGKQSHLATALSKYSIEAVKARMSVDGSVAPVSMPKKKDGLYLRPAGRQRKNMDWDAVNGKWIPMR